MESSAKIDFNVPNIFIEATKMLYDKYYLVADGFLLAGGKHVYH